VGMKKAPERFRGKTRVRGSVSADCHSALTERKRGMPNAVAQIALMSHEAQAQRYEWAIRGK
jgi:hypothetical protein